jgi:DNA polymerase III sliding clamp (beta) subunit (PCNA family)
MSAIAVPKTDFKIVTSEGYQIKVLSELLNTNLPEGNLRLDDEGITLREADDKETVMIDIVIRAADLVYEPPAEATNVGFTCQHLYKMLRRIKKKDKLSIYRETDSDLLSFNILNAEKDRNKDASIRIKDVKKSVWEMPEYPKIPITTIPASEFQRMTKEMSSASKSITVKIQKAGVMFLGGTPLLFSISDKYGTWDDNAEVLYCKTFVSKQLSHLSKCSGLAQNNYLKLFCAGEDQPIMFVSPIGSIGSFKACVRPDES